MIELKLSLKSTQSIVLRSENSSLHLLQRTFSTPGLFVNKVQVVTC